jgi:F-type H+-transporting ATPase subunit delta
MIDFRGTSRDSLATLRQQLTESGAGSAELGSELFAVATLLDGQPALRRALTDPARSGDERAGLAENLLRSQVGSTTLGLVTAAAKQSWGRPRDVADAIEHLGVLAEVMAAEGSGHLDDLEDELFRFGRLVAGNGELERALTDRAVPAAHRAELVHNLLDRKASPSTVGLVQQAVTAPRGLSLAEALESFGKIAADWRSRLVATVTTAVPLGASERDRLAAALARQYGHEIHLNVVVDPHVIGGIRVEIGEELIDGSIAGRLDDARRRLAG